VRKEDKNGKKKVKEKASRQGRITAASKNSDKKRNPFLAFFCRFSEK
jgi:hypothetical protein